MDRSEAIKAFRDARLQNQDEFAGDLGVSRKTVSSIENGGQPSIRTSQRLVALGLDRRHLLPSPAADATTDEAA